MVVVEPGETFDPDLDHVVVIGRSGPERDAPASSTAAASRCWCGRRARAIACDSSTSRRGHLRGVADERGDADRVAPGHQGRRAAARCRPGRPSRRRRPSPSARPTTSRSTLRRAGTRSGSTSARPEAVGSRRAASSSSRPRRRSSDLPRVSRGPAVARRRLRTCPARARNGRSGRPRARSRRPAASAASRRARTALRCAGRARRAPSRRVAQQIRVVDGVSRVRRIRIPASIPGSAARGRRRRGRRGRWRAEVLAHVIGREQRHAAGPAVHEGGLDRRRRSASVVM